MNAVIREPLFYEIVAVAAHLREADMRELSVTRKFLDQPSKLATAAWVSVYRRIACLGADPVFAFGASETPDRSRVQVWGFGTPRAKLVLKTVTKFVLRSMIPELTGRGFLAAQAIVHPENELSNRWLRHLGFAPEATVTGVGDRHEDMILYAVTAEHVSKRA